MTKPSNPERRKALKQILAGGAALAAGGAFLSNEERILVAHAEEAVKIDVEGVKVDGLSGASRLHTNWAKLKDLKESVPKKTIKGIECSQMVMGCNLIGGWAHSRDLLYLSDLVTAYHTREKIFATLKMAEACGINLYSGAASHLGFLKDYWKDGGKMQLMVQSGSLDEALYTLDNGATSVYFMGEATDYLVREGKLDVIEAYFDRLRKEGACVGFGAHRLESVKACVKLGIEPDFWMKTIHHDRYWSRMADKPERDNVFDRNPEENIEFMATLKQPWIGFKVLAAGAIRPEDGFRFAFESGADFICVGMYDFQIVDDVNICMDVLGSEINRKRPWCFT